MSTPSAGSASPPTDPEPLGRYRLVDQYVREARHARPDLVRRMRSPLSAAAARRQFTVSWLPTDIGATERMRPLRGVGYRLEEGA